MEIDVNTEKLNEYLKLLNEYIKKYEENFEDLFYEIEKVNSYWVGTDKDNFINLMNNEELNYELLITKLKKIEAFFSYSVNKYEGFFTNVDSVID